MNFSWRATRFGFPFLTIPLLFVGLCIASVALAAPDISPIDLHRELASGKIRSMERQDLSELRPALIVSVGGYDATYYSLDIDVDEVAKQIDGEVTMRARAQADGFSTPTLNFRIEMTVDSVKSFGRNVSWTHASSFLYVTLDSTYNTAEEFDVTVWYHGMPPTGGFMGFYFGSHGGTPMISTLSEPYMAQSWWPCKDTPSDKADSADIVVTVNSSFYAVANGVLRDSVNNGNGTTTYSWHEQYPITTYLISLAITNYDRFEMWYHYGPGGTDSMPVNFYAYPERFSEALIHWPVMVDQIAFFSSVFGEYPFTDEKYGMAHFTWGGAMEHQTVTSATSGDFGFDQYLVAHELAHQWFGDMITCRDWHHIWMNEGFASYCEALWAEDQGGPIAYRNYMNGMGYYSGGRIYIDDTTSVNNIFSSRVYDKGAWVLHMLRGVVGDSLFFATLREYYAHPDHQHKDVVTEEFRDLAESVSGINLDTFFDQWIYGYYYPQYMYSWTVEPRNDGFYNIFVHVRQYQTTTPNFFEMPIEIGLAGIAGEPRYRFWNTAQNQDFLIESPDSPTSVTFDPKSWILKTAAVEAYGLHLTTNEIAAGAQYGTYWDSLVAQGGNPPYEFVVASGALPAGLTLDSATGVVSGLSNVPGTASLVFGVWDNGHASYNTKALTLDIVASSYLPGDQNGDGVHDSIDLSLLIDFVFFGAAGPTPLNAADLNGDCAGDAVDISLMIDVVFFGAGMPQLGCIE